MLTKLTKFENYIKNARVVNSNLMNDSLVSTDKKIAEEINSIKSDFDKIMEFENIRGKQNAFVIINKQTSRAEVYRNGKLVDRFEVGVGKEYGDDLNTATYSNGVFSEEGRTTPSGQFSTRAPFDYNILNKKDYDDGKTINLLVLNGVQHPASFKGYTSLALHQVSQKQLAERMKMFNFEGVRRSMSTGCINFIPQDFYRFGSEIKPNGTHVFILPEETGNSLELISSPNGLWFKTKYSDEEKENIFLDAMQKFFKSRPNSKSIKKNQ